jgi:hypothetical protein
MSWRDTASQECQDDLDRLLQEALPLARQLLAKRGEFYPYAVKLSNSGETGMVAAYEGSEHPASTDLLTMLYDGLRGQGAGLRATAIVSDVRIRNPDSDAIRVEVEHREGVAMVVVLPYRVQKKLLGREVTYGDMIGESSEQKIWRVPA